jgi:hypothetical protein
MNPTLQKYIDICLIDEYADKDFIHGYSLDVSSLAEYEKSNFLNTLLQHDPIIKEKVLDRMQELIDERIPWYEFQHKYDAGLKPIINKTNGEVTWIKRGAA